MNAAEQPEGPPSQLQHRICDLEMSRWQAQCWKSRGRTLGLVSPHAPNMPAPTTHLVPVADNGWLLNQRLNTAKAGSNVRNFDAINELGCAPQVAINLWNTAAGVMAQGGLVADTESILCSFGAKCNRKLNWCDGETPHSCCCHHGMALVH